MNNSYGAMDVFKLAAVTTDSVAHQRGNSRGNSAAFQSHPYSYLWKAHHYCGYPCSILSA